MCSGHKHNRVCKVDLCIMRLCVLVHFFVGGFGQVGLPRHYWKGLVVDHLPAIGYWLGVGVLLPLILGLAVGFEAPWGEVLAVLGCVGLDW